MATGDQPTARAIALPGDASAWARLGFAPGEPIGGVAVTTGAPALELAIVGLAAERPYGLALVASGAEPAGHGTHPNGATVVDHVVALTDDMDRTLAARQAFFNLRTLILEVVEAPGREPALWGLTVVVEDLDALGPLVGEPRDAV